MDEPAVMDLHTFERARKTLMECPKWAPLNNRIELHMSDKQVDEKRLELYDTYRVIYERVEQLNTGYKPEIRISNISGSAPWHEYSLDMHIDEIKVGRFHHINGRLKLAHSYVHAVVNPRDPGREPRNIRKIFVNALDNLLQRSGALKMGNLGAGLTAYIQALVLREVDSTSHTEVSPMASLQGPQVHAVENTDNGYLMRVSLDGIPIDIDVDSKNRLALSRCTQGQIHEYHKYKTRASLIHEDPHYLEKFLLKEVEREKPALEQQLKEKRAKEEETAARNNVKGQVSQMPPHIELVQVKPIPGLGFCYSAILFTDAGNQWYRIKGYPGTLMLDSQEHRDNKTKNNFQALSLEQYESRVIGQTEPVSLMHRCEVLAREALERKEQVEDAGEQQVKRATVEEFEIKDGEKWETADEAVGLRFVRRACVPESNGGQDYKLLLQCRHQGEWVDVPVVEEE